jgi:uncharacterized protein YkwD
MVRCGYVRALVCLFLFVFFFLPRAIAQTDGSHLPAVEREIVRLVNQERAQRHLPALAVSEQLSEAARAQAAMIAGRRQLSHRFPGQPILSERIAATGLHFDSAGENASETTETGDALHDAAEANATLMLSPPHRENILNAVFNSIGVAAVAGGGHVWVVQDFARAFAPASVTDAETHAAQALNRARKQQGAGPVNIVSQDGLQTLACRDNVTPNLLLHHFPRAPLALVYTTYNLDDFPARLAQQAADSSVQSAAIAACPEGQKERHGSFRVVVLLFSERARPSESRSKK